MWKTAIKKFYLLHSSFYFAPFGIQCKRFRVVDNLYVVYWCLTIHSFSLDQLNETVRQNVRLKESVNTKEDKIFNLEQRSVYIIKLFVLSLYVFRICLFCFKKIYIFVTYLKKLSIIRKRNLAVLIEIFFAVSLETIIFWNPRIFPNCYHSSLLSAITSEEALMLYEIFEESEGWPTV